MIEIRVDNVTEPANSYRAQRVKSMFNATDEQATRFTLQADLPIDPDGEWRIGVVVGPSGSGKSSIGNQLWGGGYVYSPDGWPKAGPVLDGISQSVDFDTVTAALSSAGLGDVPAWLRPYGVLSTGQRFRADLAKILAERPDRVVIDEFTSVVDRQIAQVGSGAFAKAWRRGGTGKVVLLTCHYDVLDWLEPDWVFDTATRKFETAETRKKEGKQPWKKPKIDVEVRLGGWDLWPLFKPHHYLDSGRMPFGRCAVAFVDGEPVAHLGVGTKNFRYRDSKGRSRQALEARMSRLVVMPEWQGAGVGMRFLNLMAQQCYEGRGPVGDGRRLTTQFHTSHPGLIGALNHYPFWQRVSGGLTGANRIKSSRSINSEMHLKVKGGGFGGHFRAVSGFRFIGGYQDKTEEVLA